MWAGGKIEIYDEFKIGSEINKVSKIKNIEFKKGKIWKFMFCNN